MKARKGTGTGQLVVEVFCAGKPPHPLVDVRSGTAGALFATTREPRPPGPGSEANRQAWKQMGDDAARLRRVLRDHLPRSVVRLDGDGVPEIFEAWCRCGNQVLDTAWLRTQIAAGSRRVGLPP